MTSQKDDVRVLHIAPSFARRDGGPSEVLRGLLPELAARGVDVALISTDKGIEESDLDLLQVCPARIVKARRPLSWTFAPQMVVPIWRALATADVVHIHSIHTFPSTVAMVLARMRRKPYVLEPHGALDAYHLQQGALKKRLYMKVFVRWGLAGLAGAVYSSRREAVEGSAVLSAPPIMMPLGVDEILFDIPRSSNSGITLLYLGRLARKKRVDLAIRALAEWPLSADNVELVVAGPLGDDLPYDPVEVARTAGVEDRVRFVGSVDASQRRELLSRADVFVIPSEDESFGVALAEAMAAGCACVTTVQTGFASEALESRALEVAQLNEKQVAESIARALEHRTQLSQSAREYASARFRWSTIATELVGSYRRILARSGTASTT